ncbi:unnamed protein product [Rotaria socialis]|uniref:Uncharacterized protein n=1 Tax=Rotaria socialis TaxID=392032 RepID=A0A821QIH7_9BILA|nr:unnamed protein product [Rotaria socialis]
MCKPDQQDKSTMGEAMDPATIKLINASNSSAIQKKSYNSETTAEEILDNIIGQIYEEVERNDLEDAIEDDRSIDTDVTDEDTEDDEPPEQGMQIVENIIDKVLTARDQQEEENYDARITAIQSQSNQTKTPTTNPPPPPPPLNKPMALPRSLRLDKNTSNSTPMKRSSLSNLPLAMATSSTADQQPSTSGIISKRTPKRRLEFNPEDPPYSDQNGSPQSLSPWLKPHANNRYMPCHANHGDMDVTFMTELEESQLEASIISVVDLRPYAEECESIDGEDNTTEEPNRYA